MFAIDVETIDKLVTMVSDELEVATSEYMGSILDTLRLLLLPYLSNPKTIDSGVIKNVFYYFIIFYLVSLQWHLK